MDLDPVRALGRTTDGGVGVRVAEASFDRVSDIDTEEDIQETCRVSSVVANSRFSFTEADRAAGRGMGWESVLAVAITACQVDSKFKRAPLNSGFADIAVLYGNTASLYSAKIALSSSSEGELRAEVLLEVCTAIRHLSVDVPTWVCVQGTL